jgi:predicted small lipoprotein YifL
VSKATTRSLIALSVLAILSGCGQKAASPGPTPAAAPAKETAEQVKKAHAQASAHEVNVDLSNIAKAEGGKTVAEVYAATDLLAGQKVSVRGKVVKANPNIMGKNWVHVRDGSGAEGSNDLTATTAKTELPHVGDLVVVSGTVATNKDFGMGYTYPVLIENAEVKVEATAPEADEAHSK